MYVGMSQLQAINVMLATIGEAPIDSLTGTMTTDASLALACLNEHTQSVQMDGYPWNTDMNVKLTPDGSGNIFLAANCARVSISRQLYPDIRPTLLPQVNGLPQLYDRQNQTYSFAKYASLVADQIIYYRDWSQMPEAAKRYITIRASRTFADRSVGAETIHQYTQQDEMNAKRAIELDKVDGDSMNVLYSPDTNNDLYRGGFGLIRW